MLTAEENETLTKVGPDTPGGRLMRWYWQPIAATTQLDENPVIPVKLLGESLVLYRDRGGKLGLIDDTCPHRRVNLRYGVPEDEGLRCPYHGWRFDGTGQCQEMPEEGLDSTFPSRVKITAYPVEELGGLVFAYLGPEPRPLLPRWDLLVMDNVLRDVGFEVVNCNWLQMQENDLDPAHLRSLHDNFSNYALERLGRPDLVRRRADGTERPPGPAIERRDWEGCELGVMNMEKIDGGLRPTRPAIFPNMNSFTSLFMYRVPMDDTHTLHVTYTAYPQPPGENVQQDKIPYYIVPSSTDSEGNPIWQELDSNGGQDTMAWVSQGPINDRTKERLGASDKGVIMFRDLLSQQIALVEDGGEPMNVFRDPETNVRINVTPRNGSPLEWSGPDNIFTRRVNGPFKYSPIVREMVERFHEKEALEGPVH